MNKRVLIVDDNMMMREMLSAQLKSIGYTDVCKAVNGIDAMTQLLDSHEKGSLFDIVLLDWSMPEMDGIDFLNRCRSDDRFVNTAIVMVSAEGEQKNIVKAMEAGATSYLVKPFSPQVLQEKITQIADWMRSDKAAARE